MSSGRRIVAKTWGLENIREIRAEIKTAMQQQIGPNPRKLDSQKFMDKQFSLFSEKDDSLSRMHTYVLIMIQLVQWAREGATNTTMAQRLCDQALSILTVEGISEDHPKLASLYSDLYAVMSQIQLNSGEFWASTWNQQLAAKHTRGADDRGPGYTALGLARRALRLGHLQIAGREFENAEKLHEIESERVKARLHRIKIARLLQDDLEFSKLAKTVKEIGACNQDARLELEWEVLLFETARSLDANNLRKAISFGGSHYHPEYICEGRLRMLGERSLEMHDRLSRLTTLTSDKTIKMASAGEIWRSLSSLERAYDSDEPMHIRLERLSQTMSRMTSLAHVEQELLVMLGIVRWLSRNKLLNLAEVCLAEYKARSLFISAGKISDIVGCASDLFSRSWFKEAI